MAKAPVHTIEVELIYALPQEQIAETLRVPVATTIGQAIAQSSVLQRYPEIAARPLAIGIFGQRAEASRVLQEFDRIEIYRPLIADPKQARRTRARRAAKSKR
jgi:uncharacterized protein